MRVRFAPSPTGYLHIGSARTFICNWLYARHREERGHSEGPWLFNPGMRELSSQESDRRAAAGEPFVLRFRVPRDSRQTIEFNDSVFGRQARQTADIEDFALLRSNGMPTYHMASCADDIDLREKLNQPGARELLRELGLRHEALDEFNEHTIEAELRKLALERTVKAGVIINAARAALTGQPVGPSGFATPNHT